MNSNTYNFKGYFVGKTNVEFTILNLSPSVYYTFIISIFVGGKRDLGTRALVLPKLSSSEQHAVQKAKKYAMEQSIKVLQRINLSGRSLSDTFVTLEYKNVIAFCFTRKRVKHQKYYKRRHLKRYSRHFW